MRLAIKFGGTSVGSADAIRKAAAITTALAGEGHQVVVVASAMSGVTDLLLGGAHAASRAQLGRFLEISGSIRAKHQEACDAILDDAQERWAVTMPVQQRLTELTRLAEALAVLGEASPRAIDAVASLGERMSVRLIAAAMRAADATPRRSRPWSVVRTDAAFQAAVPRHGGDDADSAQARLLPLL